MLFRSVHDDTSDADMIRIRSQLVEGMQYTGVVEQFVGSFRPWLQTGDVAVVTVGTAPRIAGIITDVVHGFGETQHGFYTAFTVTSDGTISNPDNPATVASAYIGKLGGAYRQRRLLDYIGNR